MFQIQQQSVQVGAYREWDKRPLSIILQEKLLADGNAKKRKKNCFTLDIVYFSNYK